MKVLNQQNLQEEQIGQKIEDHEVELKIIKQYRPQFNLQKQMIRKAIHPIKLAKSQGKILNLQACNKITKPLTLLSQFQRYQLLAIQSSFSFSNQKGTQGLKRKLSKQQAFKAQQEQLMKQSPDEDPGSYEKASGYGGKIMMGLGILGLIGIVAWAEHKKNSQGTDLDQSISGMVQIKEKRKVKVGGDWTLIDQKGKPFSSSDLAGSYYLIYFGFTKCPDICPATLIKLGRALKLIRKMPEYHYLNLKCVFVSCDSDRDTPQRLRQYLKNFDDQIIGVTGTSNTDPQLVNCMRSFKIYANKIPMENGNYSMDHTTITYLMDDQNVYVDHLNPTLTEQEMAKAIVNRILNHDFHKMNKRKQKTENRIS